MPFVTRDGVRRVRHAGASNGVQYLVKLEGTVATFECKTRGHRMVKDFSKGPRSKQIPAESLRRMTSNWGLGLQKNGVRGHCYGWCQKCQNEMDGV